MTPVVSDIWSSTTRLSSSLRILPTPGPRVTSPVGSDEVTLAMLRRRRREPATAPAVDQPHAEQPTDDASLTTIEQALDALADGIVVVDSHGRTLLRNAVAERFHHARHADALAERVINELLGDARRGAEG